MDEILVHITAPTTRKEDEVYRALADAYHDFEPIENAPPLNSRPEILNQNVLSLRHPVSPELDSNPATKVSSTQLSTYTKSFASKDSYGSFPSELESRPLHGLYDGTQSSYHFSDDVIPGSGRLAQLERMQRSWRSNQVPKSSGSELRSSGGPTLWDLDNQYFIENTQLAAQAAQSQLPDDPLCFSSILDDTSENEHEDAIQKSNKPDESLEEAPKDMLRSATKVADSFEHALEDLPQGTTTPPSIEGDGGPPQPSSLPEDGPSPTLLMTSRPSASQRSKATTSFESDTSSYGDPPDFSQLAFEVLPPPPPISVDAPGRLPSQLTTYLAAVKRQNKNRFKPTRQSRPLDADERGCWLVETSRWPKKSQYSFWMSLCEHIRQGRLGWGVFLYREPHTDGHITGLGPIRLYCWGEIVEEVWLVLWCCSSRKVAGSGSRWLDAEEAVVIQCS